MRLAWYGIFLAALASRCAGQGQTYTITTLAGSGWDGDSGPALQAILLQPEGVAFDPAGNLYIAEAAGHRVRKVDSSGTITTIAGTGVAGFSGDGGPAKFAQLNSPYGLATDASGNLYIADLGNARVRRVSASGMITSVAGGGPLAPGPANEGSLATQMALNSPRDLAVDPSGNVLISDFGGQRVFQLSVAGFLTTIAGTGVQGYSGDGGTASAAQVAFPAGLALDRQGFLYIADTQNHGVRRVARGAISTIAPAATPVGLAFDSQGTLYVADWSAGLIERYASGGSLAALPFSASGLAQAPNGVLAFTNGSSTASVLLASGASAVAGGGDPAHGDSGPAAAALLNHPGGVAVDGAGNVYIADHDNHRIRLVSADGTITTIAGTGIQGDSGDGGPAAQAQLSSPTAVSLDAGGNLYISDTGNHRIRVVTASGTILPLAGTGSSGFSGDGGPAAIAQLSSPGEAVADGAGNVYIADTGNGRIRMVSATSMAINTVLDLLESPRGLALDGNGNLYFTEQGGKRVRRYTIATGDLISLANGAWSAPEGIAIDANGDVFVADSGREQIVEIDSSGNVAAIAGTGSASFSGDAGAALNATLNAPWDVAVGPLGALYAADLGNNRIRQLVPQAAIAPAAVALQALNAADSQPGPIAPGMLIELSGSGLQASDRANTQVVFGSTPVPILAIDDTQILVQAPANLGLTASVSIQVLFRGSLVATIAPPVAAVSPALFTNASGNAAALNQDGSVNSAANPALRGSVVSLFGTGMGIGNPPVTVTIGGYAARVIYAGPAPANPGMFQVNVQVPAGFVPTGSLEVIVTVAGVPTQPGAGIAVD